MATIRQVFSGCQDFLFQILWIASLLFADDVILFASPEHGLQHAPGWFAAECEQTRTYVGTSKSEVIVFWKQCSVLEEVWESCCPKLVWTDILGSFSWAMGERSIQAGWVYICSNVSVVLDLFWSFCFTSWSAFQLLIYGHEFWVVTERTRSWTQPAEMSLLCRIAGLGLRDGVTSACSCVT